MPNKDDKKKVVNTGPTPGLIQRLFGSSTFTPSVEEGIRIAKQENPAIGDIQPYGFISRLLTPAGAQGYTSPGRHIYLNPDQLQGLSPQDIADTIVHEQTHVNQMNERDLNPISEFFHSAFTPNEMYHRKPDEMEAFQAEQARRARMGRFQTAVPRFLTEKPSYYAPQDIQLPPERGIKVGPSSRR